MHRSRMTQTRRWIVAPPNAAAAELARLLRTSPLIAQILLNRGVSAEEECRNFLSPSLRLLHEPEQIPGVPRAAERIARAVRDRERIVVYGDYDVDGITATAILWHAIRSLGGQCDYYIPHRIEEGYGLNPAAVVELCENGTSLIISVDCGVTATEAAAVARGRGIDLIITDHHEFASATSQRRATREESDPSLAADHAPLLPDCFAIVHPRLPCEQAYPNPHLCGAGVAFKLAWAVGKAVSGSARVSEEFRSLLMDMLALAALGTIADVVPLVGENRVIARFGLGSVKQSKLIGLRALISSANLTGENIDSYHVGFLLAPRLNAAGRMGHAAEAVELLTRADESRAAEIATYLESQNRRRQQAERQILEEAMVQARELRLDTDDHHAIVLGAAGWHPGVIGIVASRIVDRFHKPTIMVTLHDDGAGQGSGRSINGFHLARALEACGDCLESHGGHEMAAGLKLRCDRFEDFRAAFLAHAKQALAADHLVPRLSVDGEAALGEIDLPLVTDLQRLAPFGQGNRRPVLCCREVEIAGPPRVVGKTGEHLQLYLKQNGSYMKAIAWRRADLVGQLTPGTRINLAIEPTINEWNGQKFVEVEVRDLQFA